MHRILVVLIFTSLPIAACGGDSDPTVADIDDLALRIVSGDRQSAPVRSTGADASRSVLAQTLPNGRPDNILPDPLVAQVVAQTGGASVTGPSGAVLPSGLDVTFRVVDPADPSGRDCGASFLDSASPDDAGEVTTFWERGTLAGVPCEMEVRLIADGEPSIDTVFVATFEPGPVSEKSIAGWARGAIVVSGLADTPEGASAALSPAIRSDQYGNGVPYRIAADSGWLDVLDDGTGDSWAPTVTMDAESVALGDTVGVTIYDLDDGVITEGVAHRTEGMVTPVEGDPFLSWGIEVYTRQGFPHRPIKH